MPLSDVGQRGLARPMRINMPRPLDLTLPIASDVAYTLPPGNVDVAGPTRTYGPAPLTVIDVACTPRPSSVDVPRPAGVDVRRPMLPRGVRQSKSSVPVDVVAPLPGPAPPTRVNVVGQQGLDRPTSVDATYYSGLPPASVDAVRQPHSFMDADVVRPTPTRADVVQRSSMGQHPLYY